MNSVNDTDDKFNLNNTDDVIPPKVISGQRQLKIPNAYGIDENPLIAYIRKTKQSKKVKSHHSNRTWVSRDTTPTTPYNAIRTEFSSKDN